MAENKTVEYWPRVAAVLGSPFFIITLLVMVFMVRHVFPDHFYLFGLDISTLTVFVLFLILVLPFLGVLLSFLPGGGVSKILAKICDEMLYLYPHKSRHGEREWQCPVSDISGMTRYGYWFYLYVFTLRDGTRHTFSNRVRNAVLTEFLSKNVCKVNIRFIPLKRIARANTPR